jgi:hypothetical protein
MVWKLAEALYSVPEGSFVRNTRACLVQDGSGTTPRHSHLSRAATKRGSRASGGSGSPTSSLTSSSSSSSSGSSKSSLNFEDEAEVAEVEMLLEAFQMHLDNLFNKLQVWGVLRTTAALRTYWSSVVA